MCSPASKIARGLRARGIATGKVTEPEELEDGMIEITPSVHVQVGESYAGVVREVRDGFIFGKTQSWGPVDKVDLDTLADEVRKEMKG
jgi:hypothetical protein